MRCKDCTVVKPGDQAPCGGPLRRRGGAPLRGRQGAILPAVAGFVLGSWVAAACGDEGASATATISVELWPTAVVTADRVLLEDVARIRAAADTSLASALRACEITSSPSPGGLSVIGLDDVSDALVRAGINLTHVILRGSLHCQVSRPSGAVSTRPVANRARRVAGTPATRPAAGLRAATHDDAGTPFADDPGTLDAAVRKFLAARLASLGGEPQIRFSPTARRALALAGPAYTFRVRPRSNDLLGLVTLEADVLEGGRVTQTVPIVAEVALLKSIVVTRRPINRGQILEERDLMLVERQFTRVGDIGLSDIQPLLGQEANRFLDSGALIAARDVQSRPLVRRGDLVTVWVRQGGLVVKTVAKALRPGVYGETIEVKNEVTKETFPVTVTGPGTAEVAHNGSSGPASDAWREPVGSNAGESQAVAVYGSRP